MKTILFFNSDLFKIKGHESIQCSSIEEIKNLQIEINFIVFPQTMEEDEVKKIAIKLKKGKYPFFIKECEKKIGDDEHISYYRKKIIPKIIELWNHP